MCCQLSIWGRMALEIVVLIQYKTKDQDDGETSRFEIQLRPIAKRDPVMRWVIRLCFGRL